MLLQRHDVELFLTRIENLADEAKELRREGNVELAVRTSIDARDLTHILDNVNRGRYHKAAILASVLDTELRDEIPRRVFTFLKQYL